MWHAGMVPKDTRGIRLAPKMKEVQFNGELYILNIVRASNADSSITQYVFWLGGDLSTMGVAFTTKLCEGVPLVLDPLPSIEALNVTADATSRNPPRNAIADARATLGAQPTKNMPNPEAVKYQRKLHLCSWRGVDTEQQEQHSQLARLTESKRSKTQAGIIFGEFYSGYENRKRKTPKLKVLIVQLIVQLE